LTLSSSLFFGILWSFFRVHVLGPRERALVSRLIFYYSIQLPYNELARTKSFAPSCARRFDVVGVWVFWGGFPPSDDLFSYLFLLELLSFSRRVGHLTPFAVFPGDAPVLKRDDPAFEFFFLRVVCFFPRGLFSSTIAR